MIRLRVLLLAVSCMVWMGVWGIGFFLAGLLLMPSASSGDHAVFFAISGPVSITMPSYPPLALATIGALMAILLGLVMGALLLLASHLSGGRTPHMLPVVGVAALCTLVLALLGSSGMAVAGAQAVLASVSAFLTLVAWRSVLRVRPFQGGRSG